MNAPPVTPGSTRWNTLRDGAIARDADRNWYLGDAALEIAPMGATTGPNHGADANLARFADEVGVAFESLRQYRQVAASWESGTRVPNTSWKVHQMLMGRQDLIRPGMTVTQAHTALGQKTTGRTGPQSTATEKAAAALALLADPEVIEAIEPRARAVLQDRLDHDGIATGIKEGQRAQRRHDREETAHDDPGPLYVQAMVLFAEVVDGVDQHRWTADRAIEVLTEGADRLTRMRDEMTTRKEFEGITGGI